MGLTDKFKFFSGYRKRVQHLQASGKRAPATVVEIASTGHQVQSSGMDISDLWGLDWTPDVGEYAVRKARLRVQPEGEPEFEVEQKFRFGDFGEYVPKAGKEIEVLYDPDDHEQIVIAPPTAEQEQARTMAALSKAKVGFTVGGGGKAGSAEPVTDETMDKHQEAMDQADAMLKQAQEMMGGGKKKDADKDK